MSQATSAAALLLQLQVCQLLHFPSIGARLLRDAFVQAVADDLERENGGEENEVLVMTVLIVVVEVVEVVVVVVMYVFTYIFVA